MDIYQLTGYVFALLVGVSLGLVGSGGSILTLPVLVYVMGISPLTATAYSLFIVGFTSLIGGLQSTFRGEVDFRVLLGFGIPSVLSVYVTRAYLLPLIPDPLGTIGALKISKEAGLMLLFALVMLAASVSMIRDFPIVSGGKEKKGLPSGWIWIEGTVVGMLTGLVGAGGGFLIIPALVLLGKIPMKRAVGTSLVMIAAKSLLGFLGDVQGNNSIDWTLLIVFSLLAAAGILLGNRWRAKVAAEKLKVGFGWMVLFMGMYILIAELLR